MLNLCLAPGPTIKSEYHGLFPDAPLDSRSNQGRLELLRRINAQLKAWKALMHRFLKSSDDQVRQAVSTGWLRYAAHMTLCKAAQAQSFNVPSRLGGNQLISCSLCYCRLSCCSPLRSTAQKKATSLLGSKVLRLLIYFPRHVPLRVHGVNCPTLLAAVYIATELHCMCINPAARGPS